MTIYLILSFIIVTIIWFFKKPPSMTRWEKIGDDYIITLSNGKTYRGECTVWYVYPSGQRCDTFMESFLSEQWNKIRWEEKDKANE